VRHSSADGSNSGSEFLDVLLQSGAGVTQAAFGVGSNENFFVNSLGGVVTSPNNALARDASYLLLVKITAQDGSSGANADQIFLAWYDNPEAIPATEAEINWQVVGATTENSTEKLERLSISAGVNADWLVDGLRFGS